MSKMNELYAKVAADAGLQEEVSKIMEDAGEDADAAGVKLVEFAKEQGYEITAQEIGEFFKSLSETSDKPLDDEELEAVAGGKVNQGGVIASIASLIGHCGINLPLISMSINCGPRIF